MNRYRLLIVDSDTEYANSAARFLAGNDSLQIAGIASDGAAAFKMVKSMKPDVVLLDPLLPCLDGLSLMKTLQELKYSPTVICISEAYTSVSIELARRYGASYYVYKPIELKALANIIEECCMIAVRRQQIESMRTDIVRSGELFGRIHALMHDLGFSFKFCGSEYIARSIEIAMESPMLLHNLSTGIYRKIAAQMNVSPACVERSMRTAIAHADSDGGLTKKIGAAPTNKTCLRYLHQALEMHP